MNATFWQGKRVLVTGHTGFKGSWLSLWLQLLGAEVLGYSLDPPTQPSLFNIADVARGMKAILGDVRNEDYLRQVISNYKPEIVFHMAAQALVRESYKDPVGTYATNVMGTVNLLEAVRRVSSVRAVICVTSDKCYENREWMWGYREYEPMGGHDPYSSSKGCAEIVTAAYRKSFFTNNYSRPRVAAATVRAGNVIGGGDWAKDRLLPDILRSLATGQPISLRNPQATRPWQHILDPLHGYLTLAERLHEDGSAYDESWNFGPSESKSVHCIVKQLLSLWDSNLPTDVDMAVHPHEDSDLMLDSTKARLRLAWKPVLDLRITLCWIVEWMKSFQAGNNMRHVTENQIRQFMRLAQESDDTDAPLGSPETAAGTRAMLKNQTALFDLVHETVMARGLDGTIAFWNRGAEEMYGWTKNEALGSISHNLLETEFPQSLEQIEAELVRQGYWEGTLIHRRRDGTRIIVNSRWALQNQDHTERDAVIEINHHVS